jgi:hypothetical protein
MIKLKNKDDYKVAIKLDLSDYDKNKEGLVGDIYWVPVSKKYNTIKPDFSQKYKTDNLHIAIFAKPVGNPSYNGSVKIAENGLVWQYRDGCFYEYVGYLAK